MNISIAMCTYNGARYLEEQLTSIVAQTRQPDELVICDDASTDNTRSILTSFAATSPIKIKLKTNAVRLGSTKNFEQAITLCDGDVVALCDQDDIWLPEKLELTEAAFASGPDIALVFTDGELINKDGKSLNRRLWQAYNVDAQKLESPGAYELLDRREAITGTTMAFRSQYKKLVLPIPGDIPLIHDGWIALIISHVANMKPIDRSLIKYRQHSGQQLGVPTKDPENRSGLIESARRETDFDQELRRVESVLQRMDECEGEFQFKGRDNLDAIVDHFKTRNGVSGHKLSNLPKMFRELLAGRYHSYSNGFSSFMKDLVR